MDHIKMSYVTPCIFFYKIDYVEFVKNTALFSYVHLRKLDLAIKSTVAVLHTNSYIYTQQVVYLFSILFFYKNIGFNKKNLQSL